jgi:hypothetical protein
MLNNGNDENTCPAETTSCDFSVGGSTNLMREENDENGLGLSEINTLATR